MLGVFYGLLAAASFGFNNASARRGVISGTALQGLVISMPLGILVFVVGATIAGEWPQFSAMPLTSIGLLATAGMVHFAWGRYFNMRSLAAVGSNLAGPVQQLQLLIALVLAVVFLGETITVLKALGVILIVSGPMYILRQRSKKRDNPSPAPDGETFKPRMLEGYTCALLAALGFGASPVLIKAGLAGSGLSFLGGFIAYSAAVVIVALSLFLPGRFAEVRGIDRHSLTWFTYSGAGVAISQMFRFLALGVAPVTIVQPLLSLSMIFRMIFGYFINRQHERFDRYVITGIMLSFAGTLVLTVAPGFLVRVFDPPLWLADVVRWSWP